MYPTLLRHLFMNCSHNTHPCAGLAGSVRAIQYHPVLPLMAIAGLDRYAAHGCVPL